MGKKLFGFNIDQQWDYENGFYLTSHISRISKILAHYELYKSIINLPGHIVECGVYKGASLIRFSTFREALENQYSRKIIGFDAFGKFPEQDDENDSKFVKQFELLEPFGMGNDEPIFEIKTPEKSFITIKGIYVKWEINDNLEIIGWNLARSFEEKLPSQMAVNLGFNEFRGRRKIQLTIQDSRE